MDCIIHYMECETLSENVESSDELLDLFDEIQTEIKTAVNNGWLTRRNIMYIEDIRYMYNAENRLKRAGDRINTIIHFVQKNESEAPSESLSRRLIAKLGKLQSKLHKKSEYYN